MLKIHKKALKGFWDFEGMLKTHKKHLKGVLGFLKGY